MFDFSTLADYREKPPIYAAGGSGGASRCLGQFLSMLPHGARMLELGCGGGIDAEAMTAAGFDVGYCRAKPGRRGIARRLS